MSENGENLYERRGLFSLPKQLDKRIVCPYLMLNQNANFYAFKLHECFCFVCFGCFESCSGYKDRPISRFSPSPSVVWRSVLRPGDWRILLLCIYLPAPFTESFWPVRKENDLLRLPERESNSSYTARVDTFPSALSTRPSLLPCVVFELVWAVLTFKIHKLCDDIFFLFICLVGFPSPQELSIPIRKIPSDILSKRDDPKSKGKKAS